MNSTEIQEWTSRALATDMEIDHPRVLRAVRVYERVTGEPLPKQGKTKVAVLTGVQYLQLRDALRVADDYEPGLEILLSESVERERKQKRGREVSAPLTPEQVVRSVRAVLMAQRAGPLSEEQRSLGLKAGDRRTLRLLDSKLQKVTFMLHSLETSRLLQVLGALSLDRSKNHHQELSELEWYLFYGALCGEVWGESQSLKMDSPEGRERFVGRLEELAARLTGERPQDPAPQS